MTNEKEKTHSEHVLKPNDWELLKPYCSERSIEYLKESFRRLEGGVAPTPSFPIYGKRDVSVVHGVLDIIRSSDSPAWLVEYEESRLSKFGQQGGVPKWKDVETNVILYATAPKVVNFIDSAILNEMIHDYRALRAQIRSATEALQHLIKTDKVETRAAGWSEFQLKKTDPVAQQIALRMIKRGCWKYGVGYVFTRFNKQKLRVFMPMPFSLMILQAKWFIGFMAAIQTSLLTEGTCSPYTPWADKIGFEQCFDLMEKELVDSRISDDEYIVYFSNDFEKMDTRTGVSQYDKIFLPVYSAAFGGRTKEMDEATMATCTMPIFTPGGMIEGDHGTASGAETTNAGETVCNDYFQRRLLKKLEYYQKAYFRCVSRRANGDDSIMIFAVKKSVSFSDFQVRLKEALKEVCWETGFDVQTEKLDISTVFGKYCQNVLSFDRDTGKLFWTYPLVLVWNSIMNPEKEYKRKDWDKDYRDIDIVQKNDNAARHPAWQRSTDYLMAGLKYPLLGESETETRRILEKYPKYRALQSLSERYNRQDYDIANSPTVRYVLSKR